MIPKSGGRFSDKIMRKKTKRNVMKFLSSAVIALALCVLGNVSQATSPENGRKAFVAHGCWQCHGFEGQGSVVTSNGKVLANTELPLESLEAFVRSTNRAMPPYSEKILSSADLADIYAFLQSVPKPQDPHNIPLLK
jgi:mono/diheme cytochrome c family protein